MYPNPPALLPSGQKPALQGVRNKQRSVSPSTRSPLTPHSKGVQKANAKHEPVIFRDQLVKHLESVPPGDFDAVAAKLDVLGNQLDYRKYEQELFEILLVGALLAPGGGIAEDGTPRSTFSVLGSAKVPVEVPDMKRIVDVFNKLMRRSVFRASLPSLTLRSYKYLQKPFEENALKGILQYTNKFTPIEQEKLAISSALFVAQGLASASVLASLKKEHLIKDGTSLEFLTKFLKAYLATESLEHLSSSLKKGSTTDLAEFFPREKQNSAELSAHFKKEGLSGVMDFYTKQKNGAAKEETLYRLRELVADESDNEEVRFPSKRACADCRVDPVVPRGAAQAGCDPRERVYRDCVERTARGGGYDFQARADQRHCRQGDHCTSHSALVDSADEERSASQTFSRSSAPRRLLRST